MTREEAEKYVKSKMCYDCGFYLGGGKCLNSCKVIEAIEALNQQKEGHWIEDEIAAYNGEYGAGYFCSVCGGYRHNEKYCSHCGAKMESEE